MVLMEDKLYTRDTDPISRLMAGGREGIINREEMIIE